MANRVKLWIGVGASVLVGTQATADDSNPFALPETATSALVVAGGEGGEGSDHHAGGEGGEAGLFSEGGPSTADHPGIYTANLLMMEGHLWVARELYTTGRQELGAMHMGHPSEEHYHSLEPALREHGAPKFEQELEELTELTRRGAPWSQVEPVYRSVQAAIERALETVDEQVRNDPLFVADVLRALLKGAAHEYEESIDAGRFVNAEEYQDARGFVMVAHVYLERSKALFIGEYAETYRELRKDLEAVAAGWPMIMPPDEPAMSTSAVHGAVSAFEFTVSKLR